MLVLLKMTLTGMGILSVWGIDINQLPVLVIYFSITLSLNVLLTLMIVVRLVLCSRNIRTAMGHPAGIGGLYKTTTTMLIESSALFAVCSLLVVIPAGVYHPIASVFTRILAEIQVRAFSRFRSSDRLSHVTMEWAGHRFTSHCSTGRK